MVPLLYVFLLANIAKLVQSESNLLRNQKVSDKIDWNEHSWEYDCTGKIGECPTPDTCEEDFKEKCPESSSSCCPEHRSGITDIVPLSTATNCRRRKCYTYYGGWWAKSCRPGTRTLYYCNKNGYYCCATACRIRSKCTNLGGHCITGKNRCSGAIIKSGCRGRQCFCCVPAEPVPTCPMNGQPEESCTGHRTCAEIFTAGSTSSGVYTICPISTCNPVLTYCDMSNGGGYTVFISRDKDHEDPEDFSRTWKEYKAGFGSCENEYWLGNEILYNITNGEPQKMRIEGTDFSGNTKWAQYDEFIVSNEAEKYTLTITGYDPASTLSAEVLTNTNPSVNLNGMKFSTKDQTNDNFSGSCANYHNNGGGFWYNSCSLLTPTNNAEIKCYYWNAGVYSPVLLKYFKMSFRPVSFP